MDYIPTTDGDLAVFTLNFVKYGEDNAARLKFDPAELAELRRLGDDFDGKLKITLKPDHTALDVTAKNTAHKALAHGLREFVQGRKAYGVPSTTFMCRREN